jgi:MYXO-CTERM domain-containing protein
MGNMRKRSIASIVCGLLATTIGLAMPAPANAAVAPFRSMPKLPSSNGAGAIAWDVASGKVTQFLEHPYRYPTPTAGESRNFAYDAYSGIRIGGAGTWLNQVLPTKIEYLSGTGIIHVVRQTAGLAIDEYTFMPMGLRERVSYSLLKVTRLAGQGSIDVYSLNNYRVGAGAPTPAPQGEQAQYAASRDAIYEYGPSGVAFAYGTIGAASVHRSMSPQNPFTALTAGQNLADNVNSGGSRDDIACGMQQSLGDLAVGASAWAGFYTVLDLSADAQAAADRVRASLAGRQPAAVLQDELADWSAWQTPPPAGATAAEAELARQSAAVLRMGQVREGGPGDGQMLASLATGKWNISWVRDMAYAVVALARSGHTNEARAAIEFQLRAQANSYQTYVGAPYAISVVRYFGNGVEESDANEDGPNIEFDGFGLFLWELAEFYKATSDRTALARYWPKVSTQVADVLVELQEPGGLIKPDSSIWEVHWNGKQRHFTYTSATAANGLCLAASLAGTLGDTSLQAKYLAAGVRTRDALLSVRTPAGVLAQSPEGLAAQAKFLDASVLDAFNFGLLHPNRGTARATLNAVNAALVPPSGRGFMRSDVGGYYDSQEWVFMDFRSNHAFAGGGQVDLANSGLAWNVDQGRENFNLLSELHNRDTGAYAGEAPMVGFGAGGYLLALADRGVPTAAVCGGAYATEPPLPGESNSDAGPMDDSGTAANSDSGLLPPDASSGSARPDGGGSLGSNASDPSSSGDCCAVQPQHTHIGWALPIAGLALLAWRRCRRRSAKQVE